MIIGDGISMAIGDLAFRSHRLLPCNIASGANPIKVIFSSKDNASVKFFDSSQNEMNYYCVNLKLRNQL